MKQGFTLVELAIVIVIIGLLVGGVLQGQELIKQAENRTIISEIEKVNTSIQTFKSKYNALPGDMINATQIWGVDPYGCNTNTNLTPRQGTCDGDGNGQIQTDLVSTTYYEGFRFWQQLANAKLISGTYPGVSYDSNLFTAKSGVNVPSIKNGIGMVMVTLGPRTSSDTLMYAGFYPNTIMLGKDSKIYINVWLPIQPFISGDQMKSIDLKMDDGLPVTGKVISWKKDSVIAPNCTTTTDPLTALYNQTSDIVCSLNYVFGSL